MNPKRSTARFIITTEPKAKGKERILKARENTTNATYSKTT